MCSGPGLAPPEGHRVSLGGLRCQGGNREVHSGQPARRPAMPLVGGGGEAGREDGERGAEARHSGGSLGPGPGASHSRASSPNPSWVLSALLDHLACPQWWTCVFTVKINRSHGDFPCKWPGEFFLRMRGLWWLGLRGWMQAPRRVMTQNTPRSGGAAVTPRPGREPSINEIQD